MARHQQDERRASAERGVDLLLPVRAARDAAVVPGLEVIVGDRDLKMALDEIQPLPVLVTVADENDRLVGGLGRSHGQTHAPAMQLECDGAGTQVKLSVTKTNLI